jgi:hypothetical protein
MQIGIIFAKTVVFLINHTRWLSFGMVDGVGRLGEKWLWLLLVCLNIGWYIDNIPA